MKQILLLFIILSIIACQNGKKGDIGSKGATGPQGPSAPVTVVSSEQQQINAIITETNAWRESQGQTALTSGLSCTVQAINSGQYLSSSSPGYSASAGVVVTTGSSYSYLLTTGFNQANSAAGPNALIDPSIQPLFLSNNYKIICSGQLVVTEDGYHTFSVSSDDGSILTIDGIQVVNNDGNHGVVTVSGVKALQSSIVHNFSLQYAQSGGGQFALILNMDGFLLDAANLYH